jgi:hypothetical protein
MQPASPLRPYLEHGPAAIKAAIQRSAVKITLRIEDQAALRTTTVWNKTKAK